MTNGPESEDIHNNPPGEGDRGGGRKENEKRKGRRWQRRRGGEGGRGGKEGGEAGKTIPSQEETASGDTETRKSPDLENLRKKIEDKKKEVLLIRQKLKEIAKKGGEESVVAQLQLVELDLLQQIAEAQAITAFYDRKTFELAELQVPEVFRLPTPERMFESLSEEEKLALKGEYNYSSQKYQEDVENWMEERIRTLESIEQHFEEQPQAYQALVNAAFYFSHHPETRALGRRLKENLDKRRIIRRIVRIRAETSIEGFLQVSSALKFEHLVHAFSYKRISRDVEREFRNLERMGRILSQLRQEYEKAKGIDPGSEETKRLKQEISVKERYISDYVKHGGVIEDRGLESAYDDQGRDNPEDFFVKLGRVIPDYDRDHLLDRQLPMLDESIDSETKNKERSILLKYQRLNKKLQNGEEISDEERLTEEENKLISLVDLRNKEWARKYTGGLFSLTGRAAAHDLQLDGLGDFFLARLLNFHRWLKSNLGLRRAEGIWNPTSGKFNGQPLDLGLRDTFTSMLKDAKGSDLDYLQELGLRAADFKKDEEGNIDKIVSLENVDVGSKKLWQELLDKRLRIKEGIVGENADAESKAEATRKGLLVFFRNPTVEKLLALEDSFEHMGSGEKTVPFVKKDGRKIEGKVERVSGQESKLLELTERTLEWMRTDPRAAESIEALKVSKLTEFLNLIELASVEEFITNQRRDFLYKEYLGTSSRVLAAQKVNIDRYIGFVLRNAETRALTIQGFFSNLLKKLLGYVFQDEVR